jgi:hypothetical protein
MKTVVVATTTLSKTYDLRARLALKTAEECRKYGYHLDVIDGGSDPGFLNDLRSFEECRILGQLSPGMGPGRREAIRNAYQVLRNFSGGSDGYVFWTEPEKYTIIQEIQKISDAMVAEGADLGVPHRGPLDSYPEEQRLAEPLGNLGFKHITGLDLDMWSGARMINATAVSYFLGYVGEHGDRWDSIFIPVIRMVAAGENVISVPINYVHPPEQTLAEGTPDMFMKRIDQLVSLIHAMRDEAKKLNLSPRVAA